MGSGKKSKTVSMNRSSEINQNQRIIRICLYNYKNLVGPAPAYTNELINVQDVITMLENLKVQFKTPNRPNRSMLFRINAESALW